MIKGGWYKILAYRDPQSGRWRQKSRGAVSQQKAWQLNEDRRLRLKTDTLPKGSEELVTALKMAIGDLGLVLGSIRARQSEDFEEDIAGAAAAFDLAASSFVPLQPFISPPTSVERTEDGLWRTGGASVTRVVEGDATFGTLKLKTASGFDGDTQVQVRVDYFSIGPSFSDRDDYNANDLQMGVVVNE